MAHDTIIVGGGVAGLALARELERRGHRAAVIERARGVGGRCATRRVDGQPVDHGIPYLHGRSDAFCAELAAVEGVTTLDGWPAVRDGDGSPCRPEAFATDARRVAFVEGVNRFAKHLARGLDIRLGTSVLGLRPPAGRESGWEVALHDGTTLRARAIALTMPAPSAMALLAGAPDLPAPVRDVMPLLALIRTVPCLTVIATYSSGTPMPTWEASFPRESAAIHSILNDSSKRTPRGPLTLVIQARPAWSRGRAHLSPEAWSGALLAEAGRLHGSWLQAPASAQPHAWRKARVAPGSELLQPVALQLEHGAMLGFAGDGFHRAGGIEGAYLSGLALAARFAEAFDVSIP